MPHHWVKCDTCGEMYEMDEPEGGFPAPCKNGDGGMVRPVDPQPENAVGGVSDAA